jgi:4'-phosphopantetheinyl transferase EntD
MRNGFVDENLHESLRCAVTKRKSEFVAGRYLARKTLINLKSNEFAICAVIEKKGKMRIGIDVEHIDLFVLVQTRSDTSI